MCALELEKGVGRRTEAEEVQTEEENRFRRACCKPGSYYFMEQENFDNDE